ncbi:MAG: hypothetical protein IKG58_03705 [Bacilli bacterium]|nr:hypothetical protein [Bacilli bacterium]
MKKIKIVLTIILAFGLFIPTVYANNLLTGNGVWESSFNEWFESAGTIESDNPNSFNIDATSIGVYQWPASVFGFGAQAKLFNKDVNLTKGKYYKYNATIRSDKDRKIFIKITDVEKNPDTNEYEDIDNVLLEKWITLQAGVDYNLDETFISTADITHISMYYSIGFNGQDSAGPNSANKIEANNISITETSVDVNNLPYTTLQKNGTNTKYSYNNIYGINNTEIVDYNGKESLKLTLDKNIPFGIKINNKSIPLQANENIVYIPINKLDSEYNDVVVYSTSRYDEKEMILAKTSIINGNVEDYKNQKINEVTQYSAEVSNLIEQAKRDIANATSISDIDRIFNKFKSDYRALVYGEEPSNKEKSIGKTTKDNININNRETDTNSKINDNPLTKDNIIFYFITLVFGVIGLRFMTRKTRKN